MRRSKAALVATVGICAGVLECGKLALAALPNIEVVTLLTAVFGYVFGWAGIGSALVFVMIEPMIWGFGPWVVSYCIYWPLVALVYMFFGKIKLENRYILTGTAVLLTVFFGLLTSFVDLLFFSQSVEGFLVRFGAYYARGVLFYLLQTGCNTVLFFTVFNLLAKKIAAISPIKQRMDNE